MKQFIRKLGILLARLAFWRKPVTALPDALEDATGTPDASTDANADAPKSGWLARLKRILPWRRNAAPEPILDLDQTVVVERPSPEQLASTEIAEDASAPNQSFFARLKNKLRRRPQLEQATAQADASASSPDSAVNSNDAEDPPKLGLKPRVLALLHNKWVLISGGSALVLIALITTVVVLLVNSAHEKDKLKAELQEAKKKLAHPVVVIREVPAPRPVIAPKVQDAPQHVASASSKPQAAASGNAGECMVSDKESVGRNLKDCIESFNNMAPSPRRANRKN